MHRCLYITEILRAIASDLCCRNLQRSVVSLALACRTICEPVLDELWSIDVPLVHLARTLPNEVYTEHRGRLTMINAPSIPDWGRFASYAGRICKAKLWDPDAPPSGDYADNIDPSFSVDWESVLRHYPWGKPALPRLKHFSSNVALDAKHALPLLSPHMQSLELTYSCVESMNLVLQSQQCTWSHSLERLAVRHSSPYDEIANFSCIARLSETICSLPPRALEEVHLFAVSVKAFEHLATFPKLKTLDICIRSLPNEQLESAAPLGFPALDNARIGGYRSHLHEIHHLTHRIVAPSLQSLSFVFKVPVDLGPEDQVPVSLKTDLDQLCAALGKLTSLRHLKIELDDDDDDDLEGWSFERLDAFIDSMGILHLCALDKLITLDIPSIPVKLSARDIAVMASAWPEIESLALGHATERNLSNLRVEDLLPLHSTACP